MTLKFGVQIPYLSAGVDRESAIEWVRKADSGPFDTLVAGDRMTFHNLDQFSVLAAAAVLTERVRIMTSITILPAHPAALVAKRAATVDVLSDGRFVLGVGVGGRVHDYQAAERGMERRHQLLDEQVAQLRRIWSGEPPFDGADPVGPPPVQQGGPPVFCSALGPKAIARAAVWADGYCGVAMGPMLEATADHLRRAWKEAGRDTAPYLTTTTFISLGDDGKPRLRKFMADYMRAMGTAVDDVRNAMGATAPDSATEAMMDAALESGGAVTDEASLLATIDAVEAAGYDELHWCVTTHDIAELDRLQAILKAR